MRILCCFLLCWMSTIPGRAQTCIHKDLGRQLTIVTHSRAIPIGDGDSTVVKVSVTSKRSGKPQQIVFGSPLLRGSDWCRCRDVRSYATGKNARKMAVDNDYGDVVVVDLNFDGLEDLALKTDGGGNGGPYYTFYLQNEKGHFQRDSFLTDSVYFFPARIDRSKKTVTTRSHFDVFHDSVNVYQYDPKKKTWRQISHRLARV